MLTPSVQPFRRRHKSSRKRSVPAPAAALTLVSASFDPDGPEVYLTFDRPIDIAGIVLGAFAVVDGPDGHSLVGFSSAFLVDPSQVQVLMQITGAASGDDVLLTAGAGNGIVASDDGGTWGGVVNLLVPFP